jgi:uncharacterized membrane protein
VALPPSNFFKSHSRALGWVRLVFSAIAGAAVLRVAVEQPWVGVLCAVCGVAILAPQLVARERLRKLLSSGNIQEILEVWGGAVEHLPHHRTVGPLVRATALAAHGLTERARGALSRAERGDAWDSALDHRLFVETLLDTFEGEREQALAKARTLSALPLPPAPLARQRALVLRNAAAALARAFAHRTEAGDVARLRAAARHHPLVYWAMRYALAVIHVDQGKRHQALDLISAAPNWPQGSVFREFQRELLDHALGLRPSLTAGA